MARTGDEAVKRHRPVHDHLAAHVITAVLGIPAKSSVRTVTVRSSRRSRHSGSAVPARNSRTRHHARVNPSKSCPLCGRPTDSHNRHERFKLPDPVLALPDDEREARTWRTEVMMQVDGL